MVVDKITKKLYESDCIESEQFLKNSIDYKEASELVIYGMEQIKALIPKDKLKLYQDLEDYISHREVVFGREVYEQAFRQGARMIMEVVTSEEVVK